MAVRIRAAHEVSGRSHECGYAYREVSPDYAAEGEWINCSIECDGGHVDIRSATAGLEVKRTKQQHLTGGCGEVEDERDQVYQQRNPTHNHLRLGCDSSLRCRRQESLRRESGDK